MTNHPESLPAMITVMTSRDAQQIYEVLHCAAQGSRRHLPPGVSCVEDLNAVMRGGVAFFVAFADTDPVGAIGYRWERGTLKIFHVAVRSAHQRLGVGRRLVQAVEAIGYALGTTNVSIEVREEWAQHLPFERFGYQATDSTPEAGRRQMRKALQDPVR